MVSAATALCWSQTINQRAAAIDSGIGNSDCGDDRDGDRGCSSDSGNGGADSAPPPRADLLTFWQAYTKLGFAIKPTARRKFLGGHQFSVVEAQADSVTRGVMTTSQTRGARGAR